MRLKAPLSLLQVHIPLITAQGFFFSFLFDLPHQLTLHGVAETAIELSFCFVELRWLGNRLIVLVPKFRHKDALKGLVSLHRSWLFLGENIVHSSHEGCLSHYWLPRVLLDPGKHALVCASHVLSQRRTNAFIIVHGVQKRQKLVSGYMVVVCFVLVLFLFVERVLLAQFW